MFNCCLVRFCIKIRTKPYFIGFQNFKPNREFWFGLVWFGLDFEFCSELAHKILSFEKSSNYHLIEVRVNILFNRGLEQF